MKREELEAMGLTKEQIDEVLDKYHEEYDPVKRDLEAAQKDLENEKEKIDSVLHHLQYAGKLMIRVSGRILMKCALPHLGHLHHLANKPDTAVILKEIVDGDEKFQTVLRLCTSKEPEGYKNSIITFLIGHLHHLQVMFLPLLQ